MHMRPPSELSDEELASIREDHMEDLGAPEWHVFDSEERYVGVVYVVRLRIVGALLVERVRALLAAAECDGEPAAGVGIAVPGIYRAATETVWAPNIRGWDDYPLVAEVRGAVPDGMTVRVQSDRACAILGEAWRCRRSRKVLQARAS